jgi:hypothetical protein
VRPVARGGVADLHRRLACRSALVVPLIVGSQVLGAVSLCYAGSGRTFGPADLAAGQRVAREIARVVVPSDPVNATLPVRPATRDAGRRTTLRRRVAARS